MPVRLDPETLTINAEIAAILARRITWDVYISASQAACMSSPVT